MKNKLFLLKKTIQGLKKLKYSITQKKLFKIIFDWRVTFTRSRVAGIAFAGHIKFNKQTCSRAALSRPLS